jgi:biotin transport system substrate-specific component
VTDDRTSRRLATRDLALIATFAALIAALGLVPALQLLPFGSPITAQTLGVMLAGSILGSRRGALAVLTFLALLAAGLPLLPPSSVRPQGGIGAFTSLSGGFLVGWVLGAFVVGWLVEHRGRTAEAAQFAAANAIGGIGAVYLVGLPVMAGVAGLSLGKTATVAAGFLPGDVLKAVCSTVITLAVLRGYPGIVPARRPDVVEAAH